MNVMTYLISNWHGLAGFAMIMMPAGYSVVTGTHAKYDPKAARERYMKGGR